MAGTRTRVILNDAQRKEVKSMWAKGTSKKDLATKFHVSTSTIANILGPAPGATRGKSKGTTGKRPAPFLTAGEGTMVRTILHSGRLFVDTAQVAMYHS